MRFLKLRGNSCKIEMVPKSINNIILAQEQEEKNIYKPCFHHVYLSLGYGPIFI